MYLIYINAVWDEIPLFYYSASFVFFVQNKMVEI